MDSFTICTFSICVCTFCITLHNCFFALSQFRYFDTTPAEVVKIKNTDVEIYLNWFSFSKYIILI